MDAYAYLAIYYYLGTIYYPRQQDCLAGPYLFCWIYHIIKTICLVTAKTKRKRRKKDQEKEDRGRQEETLQQLTAVLRSFEASFDYTQPTYYTHIYEHTHTCTR